MNIRKRMWTWRGKTTHAFIFDGRVGRKRVRKQFTTRREAELYRDKVIRENHSLDYGTLVDRITFKDFIQIYDRRKSWRTETYRERVRIALEATFAEFHPLYLDAIDGRAIEAFRDNRLTECSERLKRPVAPSTVRQELAALADFFAWAVKLRYAERSPMVGIERPSLPVKADNPATYFPPEAFADLVVAARDDAPLYEFAVWTGMRESELLGVEWTDIRDNFVTVRRGKGRKQRIIPLLPQAVAVLERVPRRLRDPRVFWWVRSRYDVYRRFRRRLRWAGLTGYRFHDLRHTFASYAAMSGVDLRVIGDALGHSHTTVTKRYAHLSPDYRRKELLKMAHWGTGTRLAQQTANHAKSEVP